MSAVTLPSSAWEGVEPGVQALLDQWLVAEGDSVAAGQVLAKVVLVKASIDVTAPKDGRVGAILVGAGETFARDQPIATLQESP